MGSARLDLRFDARRGCFAEGPPYEPQSAKLPIRNKKRPELSESATSRECPYHEGQKQNRRGGYHPPAFVARHSSERTRDRARTHQRRCCRKRCGGPDKC